MDRRAFLRVGGTGAVSFLAATRGLGARALVPGSAQAPVPDGAQAPAASAAAAPATTESGIPYGESRLNIAVDDDTTDITDNSDTIEKGRDGSVYVPKSYKDGTIAPLLVLLHGLAGSSSRVRSAFPLAEEFGVIIVAPESRALTWGEHAPGFDKDGTYIADALRYVSKALYVDSERVGIAGVSDGATYAVAMGLAYGDFFTHVVGFSEGIPTPFRKQGKPKVFIGHGTEDSQMPIDETSRKLVPALKAEGYDVTYREYVGGHGMPTPTLREMFEWFTGKPSSQPK